MKLQLKVWRQQNTNTEGTFADYTLNEVSPDMSFFGNA